MANNNINFNFKGPCRYGTECYRVNSLHLKECSHPHIEEIIKTFKNGEYTIPSDIFVAKDIILQQVDIIKNFMETKLQIQNADPPPASEANKKRNNEKDTTMNNNPVLEKKIKLEFKNNLLKPSINTNSKPQSSAATTSTVQSEGPVASTSPIFKPHKPTPIRHKIEDYVSVVAPKGQMAKKLEKAAPYNFFLTTITSSKPTHDEPLSITLQEIFDESLGDLESSLQINFMIDIGWLLAHYYFSGNDGKPLLVLYGDETPELRIVASKKPHVTAVKVEMGSPFSTHHTKMMIFSYRDNSLRVVISTANLYEDDWHNRTQGLWMSPRCPELPESSNTDAGESTTGFKESLLRYLLAYKIPKVQPWIVKVRKCDFSKVNVFFIGSVPGGHLPTPKGPNWGHPRLGYLLGKYSASVPDTSPVVVQSSSIGSLGPNVNAFIYDEFLNSLRKDMNPVGLRRIPEFKMIYPSFENVMGSHDGILGGGCLPYGKSTNDKQPWLKNFLYQWKSKTRHRNQAMPHIKTYCRWTDDNLAWFCLTSANLSKAAWGGFNKTTKLERPLRIMNYEVGVLFLPKFVIGKDYFSMKDFPMPYDVPLQKYVSDDVPFLCDLLRGQ